MSEYDFIIDGIRFSYSSTSTYNTCPYSFKLTYIDACERENNFYGEFGTLVHDCFEAYFSGKLDFFELSQYYAKRYPEVVVTPAPPVPPGMEEKYKAQGQAFFDSFTFDIAAEDVLLVEDKIDFALADGTKFVAKPDLVLRRKDTGMTTLIDYKTALPFRLNKNTGKETVDVQKINGYKKQLLMYAHALRTERNMPVDQLRLWFPRGMRETTFPWMLSEEQAVIGELEKTIETIKNAERFPPNNTNNYFCSVLCGVRSFCEYR